MKKLIWSIILSNCLVYTLSCTPCKCYNGLENPWINLKLGECKLGLKLTEIPNSLNSDLQALNFEWQNVSRLTSKNFIKFGQMKIMYIRNNKIKYIEQDTLYNMTNLEILSFSENDISELPTDLFRSTPNLKKFYINNNRIKVLQKHLFSNLKHLQEINIYKSNVSIIEEGCFANLPALEGLELRLNNLKTLSLDTENDFKKLKWLHIGGNPWNCDNALCNIINTYLEMNIKEDALPACETPSLLKGKQWPYLSLKDFPPLIQSNENKITQGQTFVFRCKHCLKANYTWIFNGQHLQHRNRNIRIFNEPYESTLILHNVSAFNSGHYNCLIDNCEDCSVASNFLNILSTNSILNPNIISANVIENITTSDKTEDLQSILYVPIGAAIAIGIIVGIATIMLGCFIFCCYQTKKNDRRYKSKEEDQNL